MTNPAPLPSIGIVLAISDDALPGSFALTGGVGGAGLTNLLAGRLLPADAASFALDGQDATLTETTPTAVVAVPLPIFIALDLFDAAARILVAAPGLFSSTRSDNPSVYATALRRGVALIAGAGSFATEGAPAERDMEVNGDAAAINWYGQSSALLATRKLSCDAAAFVWTGGPSFGVYEQPGAKVLIGDAGSFKVEHYPIYRQFSMVLTTGAFTVNSVDTTLDGPEWRSVTAPGGTWVYVTPSGGTWTEVDPDA